MSTHSTGQEGIALKPYLLVELAALYGVHPKTFRKWLKPFDKELGPRSGRYFTIRQVKLIFSRLDVPGFLHAEVPNGNKLE